MTSRSLTVETGHLLLGWYEQQARRLPWRETEDPYAILVSEVMLQQTRVEIVRQRFMPFLKRFPTLAALASATVEDVLTEWSGLGYYRRARALHALARKVVTEHGGRLPTDRAALRQLPGIGDYTSAAVASIAYDLPFLAVDGNVSRVLCRLLSISEDPRRAAVRRALEAACEPLLHQLRPGTVNQALMELGALICLPATPRCRRCPCASHCSAHEAGIADRIPPPRRRQTTQVQESAAIIEEAGRFLLCRGQRPGVLQDMWEFPTLDSRLVDVLAAADTDRCRTSRSSPVVKEYRGHETSLLGDYLSWLGFRVEQMEPIGEIRHGITNRSIRCRVFRVQTRRGHLESEPPGAVVATASGNQALQSSCRGWYSIEQLAALPLAASTRKILRLLEKLPRQPLPSSSQRT